MASYKQRPVLSDFAALAKELNVPKEQRLEWCKRELSDELERYQQEQEENRRRYEAEQQEKKNIAEENRRRYEAEQEQNRRKHELEVLYAQKELANLNMTQENRNSNFDKYKQMSKMATFQEAKDNIDSYLMRFEELAKSSNLPETEYARTLMSLLTGKAIDICLQLPAHEVNELSNIKKHY